MPNYCNNSLSIHGTNETLTRIRNLVCGEEDGEENVFNFDKIIPMPADVDWYDWSWKNWGTKWNSIDAEVYRDINVLSFNFYTAWNPCVPVIKALATMFPDARFFHRYSEPGMCFFGEQEYENGRMTYSAEGDYSEYWFCCCDEDDKKILEERNSPGVFYTVNDEKDLGPATVSNFTYRDTDDERSIHIEGVSWDARAKREPFYW